jgi:hypothetical protein
MNNLDKIAKVSISQIEFGEKLGLSLKGHTVTVAAAMIQECISKEFWGREIVSPSEGQIDFANQLGVDISNKSKAVGSAIINDILEQLNQDSIESQGLAPGVKVRNKRNNCEYTISSIKQDGLVYFKGGQGAKTWAGNLEKIEG